MKKKQIVRMVIYLLLVCGVILFLCNLFKYDKDHMRQRFDAYRELPKGSVDVVCVGTSGIDRYFNCAQGYEEAGLIMYPFSTNAMPATVLKSAVKEAGKYQNPELYIIDLRPFSVSLAENPDVHVLLSRFTSSVPAFSNTFLSANDDTLRLLHKHFPDQYPRFDLSYYFQFLRYHDKWSLKDFNFEEELEPDPSPYLGFYMSKKNSVGTMTEEDALYMKETKRPEGEAPLSPECEDALYELIDYIKSNNLNVIFISTPAFYDGVKAERTNTARRIVEEAGLEVLFVDWNDMGEYSLNPATDFYNFSHVNYYGATKFTSYISKYLKEKYDFPDHRLDEDTSAFDGVLELIKYRIEEFESKK